MCDCLDIGIFSHNRRKAEGELILEALAKSNRSYDELMDFLNGYDD